MPEYALGKLRGKLAIVWYEDGKRHRLTTGTADAVEANKVLAAYTAQKAKDKKQEFTVGQLWERFRLHLGNRPSATTMKYEWKALGPVFGDLQPSQITEELCCSYTSARAAAGIANGTVWTELGRLRMVFAWAAKRGLIAGSPYVVRPSQPPPRNLHLTAAETSSLLDACHHPHLKLFVTLAWTTGARDRALLELTWDRVDFDRGIIDFGHDGMHERAKQRAVVPMNDTIRFSLVEAKRAARSDYVIEWNAQKVGSVKKGLKRAAEQIGKPWISPHVFRHSAARHMAEAGIPMEEIAQFLGHTDVNTTRKIYARFSPGYLAKAAASLDLKPAGETLIRRVV
jgi:integrase